MEQIYNPYLPLNEYVPDGEPHVFEGRVYLYGSHDVAGGTAYCEGHYVGWSAPVENLKDWRWEGVIYRRDQDPSNADDTLQLWAPDVTRGPDGKYYLYYCLSFLPEIGVAVSDSPAGPFAFYGHVKYPDSILGGKKLQEYMPFDPAVLTDDDGRVYLYYGFAPAGEKEMPKKALWKGREVVFGEDGMAVELEPDMLTMKDTPHVCVPGGHHTEGTGFEGHGFFEASSIRKIHGKYYFVYSSHKSHELCYAVSDRPTEGFRYGGTIVSNGDIGLKGRTEPVNTLGNNHGGILQIGEEFYIFYHRQTNGTEYSRQGCAEKIEILPDGRIPQVEITSCGLNGGPLPASGTYPAAIACHLTSASTLSRIDYRNPVMREQTRITEKQNQQFITDISNKTVLGYKYFMFQDVEAVALELRGNFEGSILVSTEENGEKVIGRKEGKLASESWHELLIPIQAENGVWPLYLHFQGEGRLELRTVSFF